jgi:hypothetical protein
MILRCSWERHRVFTISQNSDKIKKVKMVDGNVKETKNTL